jgi:lipid II:glycine glycyltransferase (peptidoglycan interpeptide bridge formation enzyme)
VRSYVCIPLLNEDLPELLWGKPLTPSGITVSMNVQLSEAEIWAGMSKGHTNAINKARRAGFDIEIGRVDELFDQFALVYRETMQRLGAAPSYDFGTEYLNSLASLDEAHIAVARLEGEVAGAYLFYECGQLVQMHLGGTRSAYMRPSPSHLLIHSVALWAKERGVRALHLGGGVGGSEADSLFRFKTGFSPRRHRYFTMRLITNDGVYCELVHERASRRIARPSRYSRRVSFLPIEEL